jgi:sigma-B regulation protein RsbU (phosphoserine phosphatase)
MVLALPESPLYRGTLVLSLLAIAALADYATGPTLAASSFYTLAVVVGAWGQGWRAGIGIPLAAGTLSALADARHPLHPKIDFYFILNQALNLGVFFFLAWLSGLAGRQQRNLGEQRDSLARISEQLEDELFAARGLQALMMDAPPEHPALDTGSCFESANILGGDASFLHLDPSGCLAFGVADVSGKGSPAALAAAVLVGLLEDAPGRYRSPSETLQYLNHRLAEKLPTTSFVTMFYALLDLRTGQLSYSSAGHDPAILFHADGRFESLTATGMVLGVSPDAIYREETRQLAPGDLVFCYTDGLTDMRNEEGNRLGFERARYLVATRAKQPCSEMVRSVLRAAREESATAPDDVMLVAVRYLGLPVSQESVPPTSVPLEAGTGPQTVWRPV